MVQRFSIAFSCPMDVDGAIDGDSSEPEEDAAVVLSEGFDSLEGDSKGVLQHVFGELGHRKSRKNRPTVQSVSKPLEEHARCGAIPLLQSLNDLFLFLQGRKVC